MIEFQKKIKFLFKDLYGEDINQLTKDFIKYPSPTLKELRSRKVTITKWLSKENIKEPYISKDYEKYGIAKLEFKNGIQVFPLVSFEWSLDRFKERLKRYKNDIGDEFVSLKDYRYIYYYHAHLKRLVSLEIKYYNEEEIELVSKHYTHILYYKGSIEYHQSSGIFNFIVFNSEERMFFSFNNLDLKLDYKVYGLNLSKDYLSKNPKSSLVLLSQKLLTSDEEELFKTKLNPTNIIVADNEKRPIEISFIDNLSQHIRALKSCVDDFESKSIFLNLFLDEFNLFYNKFDQFCNQYEYYFSSFSKSVIKMINLLQKSNEKHHLQIVYTIKDLDNSFFNHADSNSLEFYNLFIHLSQEKRMSFEFVITLGDGVVINRELKEKFEKLENAGVSMLFRKKRDTQAYSTIVLVEDFNLLAISGLKGENRYKITKYQTDVAKLKKEYETQKSYAKPLKEILDKDYPLNGVWYLYGNGSNNVLHFATFLIDGDNIDITMNSHNNKKYWGVIHKIYGDILLCTDLAIIRFKEDKRNPIIRIVSLMSDQHNGNGKPIILFAILSRVEIEKDDRDKLFSALVDKKSSPYDTASFKLSLSIDEILKPLLFKYEEIYKKDKNLNSILSSKMDKSDRNNIISRDLAIFS
jgi:hypothetical protein